MRYMEFFRLLDDIFAMYRKEEMDYVIFSQNIQKF